MELVQVILMLADYYDDQKLKLIQNLVVVIPGNSDYRRLLWLSCYGIADF